jgi:hypothetical protein
MHRGCIRGDSDYATAHSLKRWGDYLAMVKLTVTVVSTSTGLPFKM